MGRYSTVSRVCAVLIFFCLGIASAGADDRAKTSGSGDSPAQTSPWTFELAGYAFVPISAEGTSTVDGGSVDMDFGPEEIFDLLEFAFSGRFEGWRNNPGGDGSAFGFVLDGSYVDLGTGVNGLGSASGTDMDIDIRQAIVDILVGYRLPRVELDEGPGRALVFDIMAGARYNFLRQEIKVTPGVPPPFTNNLGGDKHWVEPVIGGRTRWVLDERWSLNLSGYLAGFGVGGDELTWSLTGVAAWRAWERTTVRFGYRVYDIDYSDGSGADEFALDVMEHGPFLGLSYRF